MLNREMTTAGNVHFFLFKSMKKKVTVFRTSEQTFVVHYLIPPELSVDSFSRFRWGTQHNKQWRLQPISKLSSSLQAMWLGKCCERCLDGDGLRSSEGLEGTVPQKITEFKNKIFGSNEVWTFSRFCCGISQLCDVCKGAFRGFEWHYNPSIFKKCLQKYSSPEKFHFCNF